MVTLDLVVFIRLRGGYSHAIWMMNKDSCRVALGSGGGQGCRGIGWLAGKSVDSKQHDLRSRRWITSAGG